MDRLQLAAAAVAALILAALLRPAASAHAGTLDDVRARGHVACGVSDSASVYAARDGKGEWAGLAVDYCRALALATIGRRDAVRMQPLAAASRFAALQTGAVDVLAGDADLTSSRDTGRNIRFAQPLLFDGQGFLVRRAHGVTSALELSGSRVCVVAETGDEQGVMDYFAGLKLPIEIVKLERWPDAVAAYDQKSCHVLSGSVSRLSAVKAQHAAPADQIILPELAARRAVGPFVRQGDEQWFSIVRWTAFALIAAEDLGISSASIEQAKASPVPEVRRFMAGGADLCMSLGLAPEWTQRIIRQVGNYGEIYERHLGARAARMERGLNNLAGKGGLHFAPSFR
ncbi:MAG: transporter substrate-binding domain-containing protein [Hyphomicrobiaceae bacterium]|nr:transporter substrate-binding domain-containing protein [Hyphomicrobiaceae bacterium]